MTWEYKFINLHEFQLIKVVVLLQINKRTNVYSGKYFKENIRIHSIISGETATYIPRISLVYQICFLYKKILVALVVTVTDKYYP